MVPTYSSNVILAKARAMYGRRLTRANYRELLECRTVSEVASYLKNQTSYGSILAGINESDIHRGQLKSGCARSCLRTTPLYAAMRSRSASISPIT